MASKVSKNKKILAKKKESDAIIQTILKDRMEKEKIEKNKKKEYGKVVKIKHVELKIKPKGRIIKDNKYWSVFDMDGKEKLIPWSSKKERNKKNIKHVESRESIERSIANKRSADKYFVEKVQTGDGKIWYLKYQNTKDRDSQLRELKSNLEENQEHYGLNIEDISEIKFLNDVREHTYFELSYIAN